jgi:hypothetical protein
MRLPRWLLATLLTVTVLVPLGAGAWWWVTWPERTVTRYVDWVSTDRLAEATEMLYSLDAPLALFNEPSDLRRPLDSKQRTLVDTVLGRQFFVSPRRWVYLVERGIIRFYGPNWDYDAVSSANQRADHRGSCDVGASEPCKCVYQEITLSDRYQAAP